jgi:hypothetical protein
MAARLAPLCVAAGLLAPASASAISSSACNARANDTSAKLVECVKQNDVWGHLQDLWGIAQANPGPDGHPSLNSGEPGYKAAADYVANLMRQAGYSVTLQKYTFDYFAYQGVPSMTENTPTTHEYKLVDGWNPGRASGETTADVQPSGGIVIPSPGGTHAGCDQSDFDGFVSGRIALIQRGTCTFSQKVANAQAAGASGVIIFNEGNTDARSGVFSGSLGDVPSIPVAFVSTAEGQALYDQYQAAGADATKLPNVSMSVKGIEDPNRADWNVIADSRGGDPNHVLVIDGHLDSIYGAGMLDNASGSSSILTIAQLMKHNNPTNKLRFIWFGGEELGELGSSNYVSTLSPDELAKIRYDLDADVTATPNYSLGILDPAAVDLFGRTVSEQFPDNVYQPSLVARDQFTDYYTNNGKNHIYFSPVGTDAEQFNLAGIPASGVLTGQDCCKTQEEVDLFGGTTGNYEGNLGTTDGGCVDNPFRWCDNLNNNDPNVLTTVTKDFAYGVAKMANNTSVMWAGETPPHGHNAGHGSGRPLAKAARARVRRHRATPARGHTTR